MAESYGDRISRNHESVRSLKVVLYGVPDVELAFAMLKRRISVSGQALHPCLTETGAVDHQETANACVLQSAFIGLSQQVKHQASISVGVTMKTCSESHSVKRIANCHHSRNQVSLVLPRIENALQNGT